MSIALLGRKKLPVFTQLLSLTPTFRLLVQLFLLSFSYYHFTDLVQVLHCLFFSVHFLALAVFIMSRPYRQPRTLAHRDWYYSPYGHTSPRRPVILYVDLNGIPDIMESMSLPEAYTLTRDKISQLLLRQKKKLFRLL